MINNMEASFYAEKQERVSHTNEQRVCAIPISLCMWKFSALRNVFVSVKFKIVRLKF